MGRTPLKTFVQKANQHDSLRDLSTREKIKTVIEAAYSNNQFNALFELATKILETAKSTTHKKAAKYRKKIGIPIEDANQLYTISLAAYKNFINSQPSEHHPRVNHYFLVNNHISFLRAALNDKDVTKQVRQSIIKATELYFREIITEANHKTLEFCLKQGANPNFTHDDSYTDYPLAIAYNARHDTSKMEHIRVLITHGASPFIYCRWPNTPLRTNMFYQLYFSEYRDAKRAAFLELVKNHFYPWLNEASDNMLFDKIQGYRIFDDRPGQITTIPYTFDELPLPKDHALRGQYLINGQEPERTKLSNAHQTLVEETLRYLETIAPLRFKLVDDPKDAQISICEVDFQNQQDQTIHIRGHAARHLDRQGNFNKGYIYLGNDFLHSRNYLPQHKKSVILHEFGHLLFGLNHYDLPLTETLMREDDLLAQKSYPGIGHRDSISTFMPMDFKILQHMLPKWYKKQQSNIVNVCPKEILTLIKQAESSSTNLRTARVHISHNQNPSESIGQETVLDLSKCLKISDHALLALLNDGSENLLTFTTDGAHTFTAKTAEIPAIGHSGNSITLNLRKFALCASALSTSIIPNLPNPSQNQLPASEEASIQEDTINNGDFYSCMNQTLSSELNYERFEIQRDIIYPFIATAITALIGAATCKNEDELAHATSCLAANFVSIIGTSFAIQSDIIPFPLTPKSHDLYYISAMTPIFEIILNKTIGTDWAPTIASGLAATIYGLMNGQEFAEAATFGIAFAAMSTILYTPAKKAVKGGFRLIDRIDPQTREVGAELSPAEAESARRTFRDQDSESHPHRE